MAAYIKVAWVGSDWHVSGIESLKVPLRLVDVVDDFQQAQCVLESKCDRSTHCDSDENDNQSSVETMLGASDDGESDSNASKPLQPLQYTESLIEIPLPRFLLDKPHESPQEPKLTGLGGRATQRRRFKAAMRAGLQPVSGGVCRMNLRRLCQKTKLCVLFAKTSSCANGDQCGFAHGTHELQKVPDLSFTKLCPKVAAGGQCDDMISCKFAHNAILFEPKI